MFLMILMYFKRYFLHSKRIVEVELFLFSNFRLHISKALLDNSYERKALQPNCISWKWI